MTCKGGVGGVGQTAGTAAGMINGGVGGATSTGGDLNSGGTAGGWAYRVSGTAGVSGTGSPSEFGGGGAGQTAAAAGLAATGLGGGGGGAITTANTNRLGGVGTQGIIVVWEFK